MGNTDLTSLHVGQAVRGDSESLEWLVTRLTPLLLAQARYRLGTVLEKRYDPTDLVNDVWLTALPKLGNLTPREGRLTPVLVKFLSTTLIYHVNNLMKKHLSGDPIHSLDPRNEEESRMEVRAEVTGVVTAACRREKRCAVTESLDALDARDREIIVLRCVEQNSNPAVAKLLGLTPGAVASRYLRALERLRRKLPGSVFDEV